MKPDYTASTNFTRGRLIDVGCRRALVAVLSLGTVGFGFVPAAGADDTSTSTQVSFESSVEAADLVVAATFPLADLERSVERENSLSSKETANVTEMKVSFSDSTGVSRVVTKLLVSPSSMLVIASDVRSGRQALWTLDAQEQDLIIREGRPVKPDLDVMVEATELHAATKPSAGMVSAQVVYSCAVYPGTPAVYNGGLGNILTSYSWTVCSAPMPSWLISSDIQQDSPYAHPGALANYARSGSNASFFDVQAYEQCRQFGQNATFRSVVAATVVFPPNTNPPSASTSGVSGVLLNSPCKAF